jgi:phage repressor protein C with HTH and peptisase S24 domain
MELGTRLKKLMRIRKVSLQDMADFCGVTRGAVSNWHRTGRIDKYNLDKAAKLLEVTREELMYGEGVDLQIERIENGDHAQALATPISVDYSHITIPQYETGDAMGAGIVLKDRPGVISSWRVSPEWIQKNVPHCTSPKNLAIITGFGDSNLGIYNPGDPLLIDRGVTTCEHDGIYFFRVENEGFIKRLQRIPAQGILVISNNPAYRDWTITETMSFEVFGKVIRAWRGENF